MHAFNLLSLFSIIQPLVSGLLERRYSTKKYRDSNVSKKAVREKCLDSRLARPTQRPKFITGARFPRPKIGDRLWSGC